MPAFVRWPGHIRRKCVKRQDIRTGLVSDTAGCRRRHRRKDRLLNGWDVGGTIYKVHLDGYSQLPYLTGQQDKSARQEFFYFNDDGSLRPYRTEIVFCEQRAEGTPRSGASPSLAAPTMFNLRMDPFRSRSRRTPTMTG